MALTPYSFCRAHCFSGNKCSASSLRPVTGTVWGFTFKRLCSYPTHHRQARAVILLSRSRNLSSSPSCLIAGLQSVPSPPSCCVIAEQPLDPLCTCSPHSAASIFAHFLCLQFTLGVFSTWQGVCWSLKFILMLNPIRPISAYSKTFPLKLPALLSVSPSLLLLCKRLFLYSHKSVLWGRNSECVFAHCFPKWEQMV